jgi:hypothetical protein
VNGFIQLRRSPETLELLMRDPLAFALLAVIALRARWRAAFDVRGCDFGEALMGDYKKIGFSRSQYRTRLKRLQEWNLVTARPTRRGTIVRLTSTSVFNLFCPTNGQNEKNRPTVLPLKNASDRPTDDQQTTNRSPLTNNDRRKEKKKKNDELKTLGNSTPSASSNGKSDFFVDGYQNQPAQNHVKWPEYVAWCRSKGGQPTEKGFWTWLSKQAPQWRNKVRTDFDEEGYVLDGKFLPAHEANALATKNPDLLTRFQRAVKRDGKIQNAGKKANR